jgi:hypothetical protein
MKALTVLAKQNDPFRLDTAAGHALGRWFVDHHGLIPADQGIVHLRALHYVLVSQPGGVRKVDGKGYLNSTADWDWLQVAAKAARWLEYIPFDSIRDGRNDPPEIFDEGGHHYAEPGGHRGVCLSDAARLPTLELLPPLRTLLPHLTWWGSIEPRQPYQIAMIGEKSSLRAVLRPIAREVSGTLLLPTGEISDTMLADLVERAAEDGRPLVVFYFSDFDPSGRQMPVSVSRKLQALRALKHPDLEIQVHHVALTLDQVVSLDLPSTPLKESEKRASKWRERMGREQTEIDALLALHPAELDRIAGEALRPFFDFTLADRASEARSEWFSRNSSWLESRPEYAAAEGLLGDALTEVEQAVTAFGEQQNRILADLEHLISDAPDRPKAPKVVRLHIAETAPKPLFSTDDDFATASHTLSAYRAYEDEEEGGGA